MHSAQSKCITLFLYSLTESKFMIRSYLTAAVPGLIVSDVNFNFSCSVHNHRFCFLEVWCPTVFVSLRHVLSKFGIQDTLSCKVIKKKVQHCQRCKQISAHSFVNHTQVTDFTSILFSKTENPDKNLELVYNHMLSQVALNVYFSI